MIWVYAICDRPELPPPPGLEAVREGRLQAVFGREALTPDALWAHEDVVERLMADRAVLPMRFGSQLEDEAALRRVLAEGEDGYAAALARVAGKVELAVRALAPAGAPAPAPASGSGREYLMTRLRASDEAAALHAPLAELAVAALRQPGRPGELLRGAYLVERPDVERFRAAVERLQAAHPEAAIVCTGPWPPYSFAA